MSKQNAFGFYLKLIVYVVLALLLRAVVLVPLIAVFKLQGMARLFALFTPVLMVLVVLPLRFSFVEALNVTTRSFSIGKAFSFSKYEEKLKQSLLHLAHMAVWAIPMAVLLGYMYHAYVSMDAMSLLNLLKKMGLVLINLPKYIGNFFGGIFGAAPAALTEGVNSMAEGILAVMILLGIAALILLYGAVRNSAHRYLWVLACKHGTTVRKMDKRYLHGRHWGQLAVGLLNLLLTVPFLAVAYLLTKDIIADLSKNLVTYVYTHTLPVAEMTKVILPLAAAFVVLYLCVLPLRRILTARFVNPMK